MKKKLLCLKLTSYNDIFLIPIRFAANKSAHGVTLSRPVAIKCCALSVNKFSNTFEMKKKSKKWFLYSGGGML